MGHLRAHILFTFTLGLTLCACEPAPPTPPGSPPPASTTPTTPTPVVPTPEAIAPPTSPPPATSPAPVDPRFAPRVASADSAVALGKQLGEVVGGPDLELWLRHYAAWPLDIEGEEAVHSPKALPQALAAHPPWRKFPAEPTCAAITRQALLEGQPWHWLDRLGTRPPARELGRDLDKLGLTGARWWVNCYREQEAGYTLIIEADEANHARVRAIRD